MLRIRIRKHELALRFRDGDFVDIVRPGVFYGLSRFLPRNAWLVVDTRKTRFDHPVVETLEQDSALMQELHVVDLADGQRALVWKEGRLEAILTPGRHAYWKRPFDVEIEVLEVGTAPFEHDRLETVLAHRDASKHFRAVRIGKHELVHFYRDGVRVASQDSGVAVFFSEGPTLTWETFDLREQVLDVASQEIMTSDKVSLRVSLVVAYRIVDADRASSAAQDVDRALYREAQLALRAAVGGRTLDALLSDKEAVGGEVRDIVADRASRLGLSIASIGLRDVSPPGDMKAILNQVIEAEKRAEADVIRRREETAAARSQANTARLLASNPVLARMKELEALQAILSGSKATFVLGGGDLVDQFRGLANKSVESNDRE